MIYCGIDPGFSGAWGMIDHNGKYIGCGDMHNNGKNIHQRIIHEEMLYARQGHDMEVVVEVVHSMPGQGVASSFKFGMAYGVALSLADWMLCPITMTTPQAWKKYMGLTSDKKQSLAMARDLWADAPLKLEKHDGRAEALLMAEWLRRTLS